MGEILKKNAAARAIKLLLSKAFVRKNKSITLKTPNKATGSLVLNSESPKSFTERAVA
ncbi:MAG: hypothetical protein US99_C0078G0008 [Candidatus Daviesbacteria bacterium GW2011_GWF2_38_6]|uniref:Uncharacterized protein n=1 Tax=Candidatus Daviesbacteria bacterium GW2011_GWF2_38_6 TaxID=1618432 RepID=A0A0G0KLC8_9BACT|nr:MAG: hypothetical protein US99_C0078G0008 [Candidatus Daviesbacteria bacterium GW2011_GWF2_38_6]